MRRGWGGGEGDGGGGAGGGARESELFLQRIQILYKRKQEMLQYVSNAPEFPL